MWFNKYGENYDWYLRLKLSGVDVKALHNFVELTEVDVFYKTMFFRCGSNFSNIQIYCDLYGFDKMETLEAIEILSLIQADI